MITKAAKRIILLFVCPFLLNKLTPKSFPKNDFKQNIVAGNSDHHPGWIGLMRGRAFDANAAVALKSAPYVLWVEMCRSVSAVQWAVE